MKKRTITVLLLFLVIYLPFAMFFFTEIVPAGVKWERCIELFKDGSTVKLFLSSLGITALSSLISLLGGGLAAFILVKSDLHWSRWLALLCLLPVAVPGFVYVEGVVFLSELSGKDLFSPLVLIVVLGVVYLPVSAIIIAAGFKSVPRSMEESAMLFLPGNRWFLIITLSWMRPFIISAYLLTFIFSFSNYEIPSLLNTQTYTFYIFNQFGAFYNFLDAFYLVIPVVVLFSVLVFIEIRVLGSRPFFNLSIETSEVKTRMGKAAHALLHIVLLLTVLLVCFPIVILFQKAAVADNLLELAAGYGKEVGYSLLLALTGACVAVVCGLLFVKEMITGKTTVKKVLLFLSFIPFAIPPAFLAIGAIKMSAKYLGAGVFGTTLIMMWAMVARLFPLIVHILYAGAATINRRSLDACDLASGGWWRTFLFHWVPMNISFVKQAILLFLIFSIADIGMAVLLVPPDCMTASVNIYSMLHYGFGKEVAVETLLLLGVTVTAGVFLLWRTVVNRKHRTCLHA